ncbi:unnamed protein product [Miscanthus lutarioriparius]|uniref:Uncharacterized protein n=1 Tax=Miscanthus lutarioriparius TaxID=422564 RepID=A0A811MTN1_9POAL|nr:unnamed protein product [Miscanthus lutarioriparius]
MALGGGGGYAISFPAAAALAGIMDGCLDRYNELYGSDHRVQSCLAELGVPLDREPCFHQLDLKGHVYGLLTAHPVAPLVSLHHLDRLRPISPNSLKRLHAVRSLVGASRRDPARTLQQSICYYRPRSRGAAVTLSVSVFWGYVESAGQRQNRTLTEYVPELVSSDACNGTGFDAVAKVQTIRVLALKMDPAVWKRAPRRQCCKVESSKEDDSLVVEIYECKPNEAALMR